MEIRKILAFLKKDFLTEISYKLSFLLNIFSVSVSILTFFFIDKLFGHKMAPYLAPYGINYFAYVLIAIAFFSYVGTGLGSLSSRIRQEQMMGTLEAILVSPTKIPTFIIALSLWNFIIASIDVCVYLILGALVFKVNFGNINILSSLVILILTVLTFNSLGVIAASFIIVFKRGNPVTWLMDSAFGLLGGVYFPVAVLPNWLRSISSLLPVTYAIKAMQLAVYKGYSLSQLSSDLIILLFFTFMLLPLSMLSFKFALRKAKRQGNLLYY